jgi:hypothetical protein
MWERILAVAVLVGAITWSEVARSAPIAHSTRCVWVQEQPAIILQEGPRVRWIYSTPSVYDTYPRGFTPWPYSPGIWIYAVPFPY